MKTTIQRSALMLHSSERIYGLVNDVAAYPEFVSHCAAANIHEQSNDHMHASMVLKKSGMQMQLTTLNTLKPHSTITMELVEGPFEYLKGEWQFEPLRDDACKVQLDLEFEMQSGTLAKLAGRLFESVGNNLVDAFCQRANALYGRNIGYIKTLR